MAYSTSNPPKLVASGIGGGGVRLWIYNSTDLPAAVAAADYFSDGDHRGMRVGDIVFVTVTASGDTTLHSVTDVTANGAATIGA